MIDWSNGHNSVSLHVTVVVIFIKGFCVLLVLLKNGLKIVGHV